MLLLEAISLAYLFTYLLLLSSPLQGEALFLLLITGPKTQRSLWHRVTDGWGGTFPTPGSQHCWHMLGLMVSTYLWPHNLTPFSAIQMQRNLKPWEMLPKPRFSKHV